MGLAVCRGRRAGGGHLSGEILAVVTVTHLDQSRQITAHGCIVQVELLPVRPVDFIETVDIGLVYFLIGGSCHTFETVVITAVYQHLASGDLDHVSVGTGLTVLIVGIDDRCLFDLHVHYLGQFIDQQGSAVTQLIGLCSSQFNGVDLFIQGGDLTGKGIDLIHLQFDLLVDILLYFFQIARHTVEILCQSSGIAYELGFGCGTVGIF